MSQTATARHTKSSKITSSTPRAVPVGELTLSDIAFGVGVDASIEVYNGTVEGFDAQDINGVEYLVTLYRPPTKVANQDNLNPPESVSIQTRSIVVGCDEMIETVDQFRVVPTICDLEKELYSERVAQAVELLQVPQTFCVGRDMLESMAKNKILMHESFQTQAEPFEVSIAGTSLDEVVPALKDWLSAHGVDLRSFGKGEAKHIEDLAKELLSGEGRLNVEQGVVYLENRVVLLWLEAPDGNKRLLEDHQRFKSGRTRRRRNLGGLPAEKMKPDEDGSSAVVRLLKEELGISAPIAITEAAVSVRLEHSQCFPGITKRNTYFIYEASLGEDQFKKKYVEDTGDKRTEFRWINNPEAQAAHS
jgi:8-oxo-dGTP pyrophosphatase MutT (NUDIX family)